MAVPYSAEAGLARRIKNGEFEMLYDVDDNKIRFKPDGARFEDLYTKQEINGMLFDELNDLTLKNLTVTEGLNISTIPKNDRDVYTKLEADAQISTGGIRDPLFVDTAKIHDLTVTNSIDCRDVELADRDIFLKSEVYTQSETDSKITASEYIMPEPLYINNINVTDSVRAGSRIIISGYSDTVIAPTAQFERVGQYATPTEETVQFQGLNLTANNTGNGTVATTKADLTVDGEMTVAGTIHAPRFHKRELRPVVTGEGDAEEEYDEIDMQFVGRGSMPAVESGPLQLVTYKENSTAF
jgi:hypothetical protein